jgi:hypothetical protein
VSRDVVADDVAGEPVTTAGLGLGWVTFGLGGAGLSAGGAGVPADAGALLWLVPAEDGREVVADWLRPSPGDAFRSLKSSRHASSTEDGSSR